MENLIDPPLTEKDAAALHIFYEEFLNKDEHDALSFLKAVVLARRGDLREYVHNFALMRKRLQVMIREQRSRALLLSFPSTIQRVHELVWEGQEAYGEDGSTVMTILGTQAGDYLDQTEMFRLDLDSLLSHCPMMLPDDVVALEQSIETGVGTHLFLLIALADHYLLTLLPYDHPQPTEALLHARTFLEQSFGEKAEDQIIEFFVIGGGYVRVMSGRIVLCGVHAVFDPTFADPGQPESDRLMAEFRRCKFQLALDALRSELPDHTYVIQG
jgi:hypothetical protein